MNKKYYLDEKNHCIATKASGLNPCTIVGNTYIPLRTVSSWSIKIMKSKRNNGFQIFVGVAPFDIKQDGHNFNKYGWYYNCYSSTLHSGPPHNCEFEKYGPSKREGHYVHTGNSVGVVMDATKCSLSFSLRGVNYGVAFKGIPLDKPLVPCVILYNEGDSVEINPPKAKKEKTGSFDPTPSSTKTQSITWNPEHLREELERVTETINEHIGEDSDNKSFSQRRIVEICNEMRAQIEKLKIRLYNELEVKFNAEEDNLQATLHNFRSNIPLNDEKAIKSIQKTKVGLLVKQTYEVIKSNLYQEQTATIFDIRHNGEIEENEGKEQKQVFDFASLYDLKVKHLLAPEMIDPKRPIDAQLIGVRDGKTLFQINHLSPDEIRVISEHDIWDQVKYKCIFYKEGEKADEGEEYLLKITDDGSFATTSDFLEARTTYGIRVKLTFGEKSSVLSEEVKFIPKEFREMCAWKECTGNVDGNRKYSINEKNPRIATFIGGNWCTIIGNTPLPLNTVPSWSIKVLNSKENNGEGIFIGVAPFDINQDVDDNSEKSGWYLNCYRSTLWSEPPHKYNYKHYGPWKEDGEYVHTEDSVGVVMDTTNGELSFVVNGVNLGIAYEGIPLDEPLVPCVLLEYEGDSVELLIL